MKAKQVDDLKVPTAEGKAGAAEFLLYIPRPCLPRFGASEYGQICACPRRVRRASY
jgi:hypothetical protein